MSSAMLTRGTEGRLRNAAFVGRRRRAVAALAAAAAAPVPASRGRLLLLGNRHRHATTNNNNTNNKRALRAAASDSPSPSASSSAAAAQQAGGASAAAAGAGGASASAAAAATSASAADQAPLPATDQLTPEQLDAIQKGARQRRKLRKDLEEAAKDEDYRRAAALRDELGALERADPLVALARRLEAAVAGERYAEAAALRDALRALEDQVAAASGAAAAARRAAANEATVGSSPSPSSPSSSLSSSTPPPPFSDTTTGGIRVVVRSAYVPSQSSPADGRWFFVYRVRITNTNAARTVQLKARHWCIRDASGRVDHVRGPGVVGEQPVLPPSASFEYESACPLRTPTGSMEGEFEFVVLEGEEESGGEGEEDGRRGGEGEVEGGGRGGARGAGGVMQALIGRFGLAPHP